jgi:hypothetical protein
VSDVNLRSVIKNHEVVVGHEVTVGNSTHALDDLCRYALKLIHSHISLSRSGRIEFTVCCIDAISCSMRLRLDGFCRSER